MSFCRWSSDDYTCDLYVYQHHAGHYVIHVAAGRFDFDRSTLPALDGTTTRWIERHMEITKRIESAKTVPIGLPYDGKSCICNSRPHLVKVMRELKEMGYCVPDWAITNVEVEELAEAMARDGDPTLGLRTLPNHDVVGVRRFMFTWGLLVGIDGSGYRLRYCYEHQRDALNALMAWDGVGDPPGPWVKKKGLGVDQLNPALFNGESDNAKA
jgi:hypothetical protein